MRRKKKKKKKLIIFLILFIILLLFSSLSFFVFFDYEENIKVALGDEFKPNIKANYFFRDVSNDVDVSTDVDVNKVGEYDVTYTYKTILNIKKTKKGKVIVVDKTAPSIELKGDNVVYLLYGNKYNELGYIVKDNYDKEEDIKVVVDGDIDVDTPGVYYVKYTAIDSSNNKKTIKRKVIVRDEIVIDLNIKEFDINNYFDNSVILGETEDMGEEYINDITFVGDSVPWQFGLNNMWNTDRVYAAPCTGPMNVSYQPVYWKNKLTKNTILDLVSLNKPKYILVSIGFCEIVSSGDVDSFISYYDKFIDDVNKNSPDTTIILASIYPVISETLRGNQVPTNKQVNEYNYYTAYIAQKNDLKFLNYSEVVKNSQGLAEASLTMDDGYHPNIKGMKEIIKYIRTHGYKN